MIIITYTIIAYTLIATRTRETLYRGTHVYNIHRQPLITPNLTREIYEGHSKAWQFGKRSATEGVKIKYDKEVNVNMHLNLICLKLVYLLNI